MTTSQHRETALKSEKLLLWALAAEHWREAIREYPTSGGAIAIEDMKRMIARERSCLAMISRKYYDDDRD